jgi:hypothetical protein
VFAAAISAADRRAPFHAVIPADDYLPGSPLMNPFAQNSTALTEPFASLRCHRGLVWQMTRREVVDRYHASVMGIPWLFFNQRTLRGFRR